MIDRVQNLAGDYVALLQFSFLFGGFLVVPIYLVWFSAIRRSRSKARFFFAWTPLALVAAIAVVLLVYHLYTVDKAYLSAAQDSSGPVSAFPFQEFPYIVFSMMVVFSSAISPLLICLIVYHIRSLPGCEENNKNIV